MRLDLLLKNILIFKKRNTVKSLCQSCLIKVDGRNAKPSKKMHEGDIIEIETPQGIRKLKILKIPKGNISKQNRDLFYEELSP